MRNDKAILLPIPVEILEQVDSAVSEQNVTRVQFLRQSVERNLHHYMKNERQHYLKMRNQGMV